MQLNWIKITLIMITINIVTLMCINIYSNSITPKDILGYYNENEQYQFDSEKDMGVMPSILLFSKSMGTNVNNLKEDDTEMYYKTSQNFWNIIDGIINIALFVGMFFEITINVLFSGLDLKYAQNTTELFILSFIVFLVSIGNLVLIIKGVQFWVNKDTR
jgi:hypothetical protein